MATELSSPDESEALACALGCLDLLTAGKFEEAFSTFGYALAYQHPSLSGGAAIQQAIEEGRPGSRVTDWRVARCDCGGPVHEFVWYQPNETGLVGALSIDLPLDGAMSNLAADFVVSESCGAYFLTLEHIYANPGEDA